MAKTLKTYESFTTLKEVFEGVQNEGYEETLAGLNQNQLAMWIIQLNIDLGNMKRDKNNPAQKTLIKTIKKDLKDAEAALKNRKKLDAKKKKESVDESVVNEKKANLKKIKKQIDKDGYSYDADLQGDVLYVKRPDVDSGYTDVVIFAADGGVEIENPETGDVWDSRDEKAYAFSAEDLDDIVDMYYDWLGLDTPEDEF